MSRTAQRLRRLCVVSVALGAALSLAGCSLIAQFTQSQPAPVVEATSAPPIELDETAVVDPEATAEQNLAAFTEVMLAVHGTDQKNHGRAYVDALIDAGYQRDAMQVTKDLTTVGLAADVVQFSVAFRDACVVGQVGPSTDRPTAKVLPLLPDAHGGACLLGNTRPIDW